MRNIRGVRAWAVCLTFLMFSSLMGPVKAPQDVSGKVADVLARIEKSGADHLWTSIGELEQLGKPAMSDLRDALGRANPYVKLACAKALHTFGDKDTSFTVLLQVLDSKEPAARQSAADLLGALASQRDAFSDRQKTEAAKKVEELAGSSTDRVKVSLWRTLYQINRHQMLSGRRLKDLLKSEDREVRDESALALAEMDRFNDAEKILKEMAADPAEKGKLARAYLRIKEVRDDLTRQRNSVKSERYELLDEIVKLLGNFYYDPDRVKENELIEAAAKGMSSILDPHTAYLDEKMLESLMREDLEGEYGGIGARVNMRKDKSGVEWLTIEEPIFSGPAYKARIKSMDRITRIEGELTANKDLSELVRKLRGKPGTEVKFHLWRRGFQKEKEYTLVREKIVMETTLHKMLPGNIGYIKISTFGERNVKEVEQALGDLKHDGIKALIFDLRGNSGGYLKTCVDLAALFLENKSPVVTTRGSSIEEDVRRTSREPVLSKDIPMVILVDDGSASASEILAGAMQDYKRAVLIGGRTFGKGSVQDIKRLSSKGEKAALRLTVAKWYLPSNRTVEKDPPTPNGLDPDIAIAPPENDLWLDAEFDRLEQEGKIDDYMKEHFEAKKHLFRELAESDGKDPGRYPEFDKLYETMKSRATREQTLEVVRKTVRRWVANDRGQAFFIDYQTDVQLQRGILELCEKIKLDPAKVDQYKYFAKADKPASGGEAK